MHKEIAERWTSALRSGKYQQTLGYLHRTEPDMFYPSYDTNTCTIAPPGYCCLGVLCMISNMDKFDDEECYLGCNDFLPEQVTEWAGLQTNSGTIKDHTEIATPFRSKRPGNLL